MGKNNTTTGGFDISGENTLLLDNAVYKQKQNKLLQSASELIFDKAAFDMEDVVCGTEGMVLLADYWHKVVDSGDRLRNFLCEDVDMICTKVQDSINEMDQSLAASLSCNAMGAGKSMLGAFMGRRSTKQKEEPDDAKGTKDTTVEKIDDEFGDIQTAYHFSYDDIQYLKVHARDQLEMLRVVQNYSSADANRIVAILKEKLQNATSYDNSVVLKFPERGSKVTFNDGDNYYTVPVANEDAWSVEFDYDTSKRMSKKITKRLDNLIENYPNNNGEEGALLQFDVPGYGTCYAGAMVEGYGEMGDIVEITLDKGEKFYFILVDCKFTHHSHDQLALNQVQNDQLGHGYLQNNKTSVSICPCEFMVAGWKYTDDTRKHKCCSAKLYESDLNLEGKYVKQAEIVGHIDI